MKPTHPKEITPTQNDNTVVLSSGRNGVLKQTKESRIHKCKVCNRFFTRLNTVNRHLVAVHGQSLIPRDKPKIEPVQKFTKARKVKKNQCDICSKTFSSIYCKTRHILTIHGKKDVRGQSPIPGDKPKIEPVQKLIIKDRKVKRNQCNISSQYCKTRQLLTIHGKKDENKLLNNKEKTPNVSNDSAAVLHKPIRESHVCSVCSKRFRSLAHRVHHEETNTRNPKCAVCSKKLCRKKDLRLQEKNHVKQSSKKTGKGVEKKHINNRTDHIFVSEDVTQSKKSTSKKKIHKCLVCSTSFDRPDHLRRHEIIHQPKLHKCLVCLRSFHRLADLQRHDQLHQRRHEKMYKCLECSKSFNCPDDLQWHEKIHQQKIHNCWVCSKSFPRPDHLRRHVNIHEKERQNKEIKKPDPSPKNSAENKNSEPIRRSKRHQKTHLPLSFKCPDCEETFLSRENWNKHMKIHMLETKNQETDLFPCNQCSAKLSTYYCLLKHHKLFHKSHNLFLLPEIY